MKKEYKFIMDMVRKQRDEKYLIDTYKDMPLDWAIIGGQLLHNRLGGYFFNSCPEELKKLMPKELFHAIDLLCLAQDEQTKQVLEATMPAFEKFKKHNIKYAGLKGIMFLTGLYGMNERRTNDTDILVSESQLNDIDEILRSLNYIQTYLPNGEFVEASRKEKLIQRMNYHDTVPYGKLIDHKFLKYHFFDLNFQFDSKENDITDIILNNELETYEGNGLTVSGLNWEVNLCFLCIHYYREATNSIWIDSNRDLTLYKLVDIVNFMDTQKDVNRIKRWHEVVEKYKLEKPCYFTMKVIQEFYQKDPVVNILCENIKINDDSFMTKYKIDGSEMYVERKRTYIDLAFDTVYPKETNGEPV